MYLMSINWYGNPLGKESKTRKKLLRFKIQKCKCVNYLLSKMITKWQYLLSPVSARLLCFGVSFFFFTLYQLLAQTNNLKCVSDVIQAVVKLLYETSISLFGFIYVICTQIASSLYGHFSFQSKKYSPG